MLKESLIHDILVESSARSVGEFHDSIDPRVSRFLPHSAFASLAELADPIGIALIVA
jgi:hypothetical protein